ncbi:MAG TPA: hypothetical protein VFS44_10910 [Gemmatimonadaceae bacterium]|nr:hypothetical protein [Gemmatimonadaceae bacterium]
MERARGGGREPSTYYYRRNLRPAELLPAIGIGVGAGLTAFYFARILLQRTPLEPAADAARPRAAAGHRAGAPAIRSRS